MSEVNKDYQLYLGDCLELMKAIPSDSVDMVLCDLPYGTTQNKWDSVIPLDLLWAQYNRIIKQGGAIVLHAGQPFSSVLTCSNLEKFKYQWTWVKTKITGVLNAKKMPVRKHEHVLVFANGKTIYNAQGLIKKESVTRQGGNSDNYGERNASEYFQEWTNWPRDVLEIASQGKTVHPTQKPVPLAEYLIRTYTDEGMTVLDNCMGSGTTGVACANTGRRFIGMEMDPGYFEICERRIGEAFKEKFND